MEKPLYILIFLLLWSTRIRGGEEEDIDGTLSPSTQKNGDRNSLIDKASSSTITKTSTIFDPDSESSETESSKTESPPIKSKALETNTGTEEPSVANYVTPKPARDSTIANTTTLTIPYSDSSEIQSPTIKPEALKTTKASTRTGTKTTLSNLDLESSETDLASTKSEATEIKPESLETDSPPDKSKAPRTNTDSTTAKTTSLSNSDSESSNAESPPIKSEAPDTKPASTAAKARTAIIGNPDSENTEPSVINFETNGSTKEPLVPDSPTIRSKAQETKTASTKTATKPATTSNIDLESSETDSASIKSKAQETEIDTQAPSVHNFESPEPANASTLAKSKTTTMRDADSESSETDSPPIESETPKTKIGIESTPVKSRTTRTTHENHHQESSLFQTKTSRATTDIKPQNQRMCI